MEKLQLVSGEKTTDFLLLKDGSSIKIPKSKIPDLIKELELILTIPETKVKILDL